MPFACIVEKALEKDKTTSLRSYLVTFTDDGLQAEVTEDQLLPSGLLAAQSIFEKFQNEDPGSYTFFAARENVLAANQKQLKNGNALRALLSSRIDLRPHQAYATGVVLLDESRAISWLMKSVSGRQLKLGSAYVPYWLSETSSEQFPYIELTEEANERLPQ